MFHFSLIGFALILVLFHIDPLTTPLGSHSTTDNSRLISEDTHRWISDLIIRWNSTGLCVAVVKRSTTYDLDWTTDYGSYGIATGAGDPVTPDTLFSIASNSKQFLAISVGLLIENKSLAEERGQVLKWGTKASDALASEGGLWKLWDEDAERILSIQDMLSHRSGLPRHDMAYRFLEGGTKEMIQRLRFLRPSAEIRQHFQYNNFMYEALAYLPRLFLNQTYEAYVQQHLLGPLGMNSSTFSVETAETWTKDSQNPLLLADGFQEHLDKVAGPGSYKIPTGHDKPQVTYSVPNQKILKANHPYFLRSGTESVLAGAGGVITCARDLTTWVKFLLNNGRHPTTNVTVVPEKVIDYISTGISVSDGETYPEISPKVYGAGQWRYSYMGHEIVEHLGNSPGYHTRISRYPADNIGVVVLSNDETARELVSIVKWRLTEDLLGLPHVDWERRALENRRKQKDQLASRSLIVPRERVLPTISESMVTKLEGAFHHGAYGTLRPCYQHRTRPQELITVSRPECKATLEHPVVRRVIDSIYTTYVTAGVEHSTLPAIFVSSFRGVFFSYIFFEHFDGNIFNGSFVWSNWDDRKKEGYGSSEAGEEEDPGALITQPFYKFTVEYVPASEGNSDGWAFHGNFWGASLDSVDGVNGELKYSNGTAVGGREGAEVWFGRCADDICD